MKIAVVCAIFALATLNVDGGVVPEAAASNAIDPMQEYERTYRSYKSEYTRMFEEFDYKVDQALAVNSGDPNANIFTRVATRVADCSKLTVSIGVEVLKRGRESIIALLSHIQAGRIILLSCYNDYGLGHPVDFAKCSTSTAWKTFEGGIVSQMETVTKVVRQVLDEMVPRWVSTCTGQSQ